MARAEAELGCKSQNVNSTNCMAQTEVKHRCKFVASMMQCHTSTPSVNGATRQYVGIDYEIGMSPPRTSR